MSCESIRVLASSIPSELELVLLVAHEGRRRNYLNDYVANVVQTTARILEHITNHSLLLANKLQCYD
jgi:hypothetical protein